MAFIKLALHQNTDLSAVMIDDMPPPSNYNTMKIDKFIKWDIDGYFGTSKGNEYIRDVAHNLSIHFKTSIKEIFTGTGTGFKLGVFKYLEDKRVKKRLYTNISMRTNDPLFDSMRDYAYALARAGLENVEDEIVQYGLTLSDSFSKVRSKARNINRWLDTVYKYKDYTIKKRGSVTQKENALKQTRARSERKYNEFVAYAEAKGTKSIEEMSRETGFTWTSTKKYYKKWLDNRVKTAQKTALSFIYRIRGLSKAPEQGILSWSVSNPHDVNNIGTKEVYMSIKKRKNNYKKTNPFYHSSDWKRARETQIRQFPLCVICEKLGKVKSAEEVDHIMPIKISWDLRLEPTNLQSLCQRCHSKKTANVDKKLLAGEEPEPQSMSGVDGLPVDSNHSWNK